MTIYLYFFILRGVYPHRLEHLTSLTTQSSFVSQDPPGGSSSQPAIPVNFEPRRVGVHGIHTGAIICPSLGKITGLHPRFFRRRRARRRRDPKNSRFFFDLQRRMHGCVLGPQRSQTIVLYMYYSEQGRYRSCNNRVTRVFHT